MTTVLRIREHQQDVWGHTGIALLKVLVTNATLIIVSLKPFNLKLLFGEKGLHLESVMKGLTAFHLFCASFLHFLNVS